MSQRSSELLKLEILGDGERTAAIHGEVHQLLSVGVGERLQQHGVDDREDRSVGTDAHGEREDRDGGKHRRTPERTPPVAKIDHEILEPWQPAPLAQRLHALGGPAVTKVRSADSLRRRGATSTSRVGREIEM